MRAGVGAALGAEVELRVGVADGVGVGVGLIQFTGHRTRISVAVCPARACVMLPVGVNLPATGS